VTDLVQIIRPWVVVDVTPPAGAQAAGSSSASSPTNLAIGKNVAPHNVEQTSGSYDYDIMFYMHAVATGKEPKPPGGKKSGKTIGKGGVTKSGSSDGTGKRTDEDTNVKP
jgi:hypothetical protein